MIAGASSMPGMRRGKPPGIPVGNDAEEIKI